VQAANAYQVELRPDAIGAKPRLMWRTQEDGRTVDYDIEPARSDSQRNMVRLLSLLPLDSEL
jgi:cardiolipin synthase C